MSRRCIEDRTFDSVRVTPVADAVARNRAVLDRLALTGMDYGLPWFIPARLDEPISFRRAGKTALFSHVSVSAFGLGGDIPRPEEQPLQSGMSIEAAPIVSMRLQNGADAKSGVVTRVKYADFEVSEMEFAGSVPDFSGRLIPESFSVQRGNHHTITEADREALDYDVSEPANFVYGGEELMAIGGPADRGDIARLAARTIDATTQIYGVFGQAMLNKLARLG